MSRANSLETLARVETARERNAAQRMVQQRGALKTQQERLAGLVRYHEQYAGVLLERLNSSADSAQLSQYRCFLARLEEAIARQERQVEVSLRAFHDSERQWLVRRARAEAVDRAAGASRALLADEKYRQDLREADALSLRQWLASRR